MIINILDIALIYHLFHYIFSSKEIHNLISGRISNVIQVASKENDYRQPEAFSRAPFVASKPQAVSLPLPTSARSGCVLLIDDSPVAAKVATKVLEGLSLNVTAMNSANSGFDTLKANPNKFCLIFLDVVMPKVDGVEALSWFKEDPETAHVPVGFIS